MVSLAAPSGFHTILGRGQPAQERLEGTVSALRRSSLDGALALAAALALSACASPVVHNPAPHALLTAENAVPANYEIGAGDEIELKFYYNPELNDRLLVRPDGKISVGFLQDVQAAGRTPTGLAQDIRAQLAPHLRQPDVVVSVRGFGSQRVFVGGEVARPGPVPLTSRASLLQVLTEAGWVRDTARKEELVLVRRDPAGGRKIFAIDMEKALSGEDMSQDVALRADDMLFVPPSAVANFDRWVDQHIRQALFFSTNVGASFNRNWGGNNN